MRFIDDPRVDVYFSTWDKTIYKMPLIELHKAEDVTQERILNDLKRSAVIEIEPHNLIDEKRYNSKMIHRWKRGISLIKNSGIEYDYILILRPDLYFDELADQTFNDIEEYKDILASGWANSLNRGFLNDVMCLSSADKIIRMFDDLTIENWTTAENTDWHTWWYSFVSNHFPVIKDYHLARCTFCRVWTKENHSFAEIQQFQEDWSDLTIQQLSLHVGRGVMEKHWPAEVMDRSDKKWNSGYYERYKPRIALIISGMLRNYNTARLSLDIWGLCDRYLITWESAGQEAINDYCVKADIKEKFIISDNEFEDVYKDPCKNGNNTFRMVYLWGQVFNHIPKDYDKYIIIRPDGFYWTTDKARVLECIRTEGPFKVNQHREDHTTGIDDHVLFIDKSHLNLLENCYDELVSTALAMIKDGVATNAYGDYLNPHEMLFRMWKQNISKDQIGTDVDFCSKKLHSCIEALWVRNTFTELHTDKYDKSLYTAIFYDTAAYWRRSARCNYHGTLNRLG
jgi:hypothetical protein